MGRNLCIGLLKKNKREAIAALIEGGVDVNLQGENSCTALHIAILSLSYNGFELLIKAGVNVNIKDQNGCTALHLAFKEPCIDIIQDLVKAGADVNATNNKGETALHLAAKDGTIKIIQELVEAGADVNAINNKGETALQMAIENNQPKVISALLAGGGINSSDLETALNNAILNNKVEIMKALLSHDADKIIVNKINVGAGYIYDDLETWREIEKIVKILPSDQRLFIVCAALEKVDNTSRRDRLISFLSEHEQNIARSRVNPSLLESIRETVSLVHGNSTEEIPVRSNNRKKDRNVKAFEKLVNARVL